MQIPGELRYSSDHEWASANGDVVRVGITDYAQDALGDVVFVDLPAVARRRGGRHHRRGRVDQVGLGDLRAGCRDPECGEHRPVASPELVNADPYGEGWICEITTSTGRLRRLARCRGLRLADQQLTPTLLAKF